MIRLGLKFALPRVCHSAPRAVARPALARGSAEIMTVVAQPASPGPSAASGKLRLAASCCWLARRVVSCPYVYLYVVPAAVQTCTNPTCDALFAPAPRTANRSTVCTPDSATPLKWGCR